MFLDQLIKNNTLYFEDNEYTAGIYFYPLLRTKMENTTPIQKQIINPLIRVDQLKVVDLVKNNNIIVKGLNPGVISKVG